MGRMESDDTGNFKVASRLLYRLIRIFYRILFRVVFPLRVTWPEGFQFPKGPVILAGNHTGLLDGPMLIRAVPFPRVVHFMIEIGVLDWPIIGGPIRHLPVVIIDQKKPKKALVIAAKALKAGKTIAIFPEGKLTQDGELNEFHPGVFLIQSLAPDVPILPFALEGGFKAWPDAGMPRPGRVAVHFGDLIPYNPDLKHDEKAEALKQVVAALLKTRSR
jgi:1-acyl-sn-glycerol-3-phosphate acyltransferase